jgi:Tol biopolymer transport system component
VIERRGRHGRRWNGLFVLNANGTEVRVAFGPTFGSGSAVTHYFTGGSFSPDGSRVVYADLMDTEGGESSKIYTVDSNGGTPQFLRASQSGSPEFFDPAFSPDGQQIAYIAGWGDHDNGVWVMNADGSGARELADPAEVENPHRILGWSTDG